MCQTYRTKGDFHILHLARGFPSFLITDADVLCETKSLIIIGSMCQFMLLFVSIRIVDMDTKRGVVGVKNPKEPNAPPKEFTFDAVYDWK